MLASHQRHPVMCITQDGLALSHGEQVRRLCAAGARWIQLRMKSAVPDHWISAAREAVGICDEHGAICIVNDSVEIALATGAHGVHLGRNDLGWREARARLGAQAIIGGTVNNLAEARLAREAACLDYVGVGPLRFTRTKEKISPVLGFDGVREVLAELGDLPAWVIGGVQPGDLSSLRAGGAAGIAVSSALFHGNCVEENFRAFQLEAGPLIAASLS